MYGVEIIGADLTTVGNYRVSLSNVGNPDHGQDTTKPLPGTRNKVVPAETLKNASTICQAYIRENNLGGGNWTGGDVTLNGVTVARVSYNGRVWAPEGAAS